MRPNIRSSTIQLTMKLILSLIFSTIFFFGNSAIAQNATVQRLKWQVVEIEDSNITTERKLLGFDLADYAPEKGHMPRFIERIDHKTGLKPIVRLEIIKTRTVNNDESTKSFIDSLDGDFDERVYSARQNGYSLSFYELYPLRKISANRIEIIEEFKLIIDWDAETASNLSNARKRSGKIESKLRSGDWHKISVNQTGIFKIDKSFLDKNGISVSGTDVSKIAIYGYGGKELPMLNSAGRPEDLAQIPSKSFGLSDGSFDAADYIVFYAEGPITWSLNNKQSTYRHNKHAYAEKINYLIGIGVETRKEPSTKPTISKSADKTTDEYDYLYVHHIDQLTDISKNVKTGKEWFGEEFNFNTVQTFNIGAIEGLVMSDSVRAKSSVVARSVSSPSQFLVKSGGKQILNQSCARAGSDYLDTYVHGSIDYATFLVNNNTLALEYEYSKPSSASIGWLNYFEIHARAKITYSNKQLIVRDKESQGTSESVVQYNIATNSSDLTVWSISNINGINNIPTQQSGNNVSFKTYGNEIKEFIIFNASNAYEPKYELKIENQNLHGMPYADVLIVAYDSFITQAKELAQFHADREGFDVNIVTPQQIYNEFSSGTQDITAIRDFVRYFYEAATSEAEKPSYLIMFGDASYDYKDRILGNTNLVPSYQSNNSTDPTASYVSDDYFGLLDPEEGDWESNDAQLLDIAIGRLPVKTTIEAKAIVNKIKAYHDERSLGDWRNNVLFVADDEDGNLHLNQTEEFANLVDTAYPLFNIKKIYFDSYPQEIGPGGAEYPEVEKRLDENIESGVLVLNYMGHGGELGWAHERVLDNTMISGWDNLYRMPLFVTATCEFSRFDDPERTSAGENVFLNPNGGAIAMLTTTRVVYAGANAALLRRLYTKNAFEPLNDKYRTLGEIIMTTKNKYSLTTNTRNFTLLGDPTIRLAYPKYRVVTTTINGKVAEGAVKDTIQALSKVTISGMVANVKGEKLTDFNGVVYPTVFDKIDTVRTLANDPGSNKTKFGLRKNIIYKGKATVKNGDFEFEFVVPKDISYKLGKGKISYYTENTIDDGNGSYFDFFIGGTSNTAISDDNEPEAEIFINDLQFSFGGLSNEDPLIIGTARDDNGINTVGTGIGHELTLTIDDGEPIVVNEYYESELDDYTSGTISYPVKGLSEGRHSASLKVWDVANNSATAYTEFVVANSAELALEHIINYPNPFSTSTTFWMNHNRPGDLLDVTIQIFSISGKLVKTLKKSDISNGSTFNEITWDGRDDFGNKIGKGVYIYKLYVKASDGVKAEAIEKLVILN